MKLLRITFSIVLLLSMNVIFKATAQDWANLNHFKEENTEAVIKNWGMSLQILLHRN